MNYGTDISPAIKELKKLHELLIDHIEANVDNIHKEGLQSTRETVISILPGERRKEDGWYKWRMWQKHSDSILHELDRNHKVAKYHEIFISGEALQKDKEGIVLVMMHQVAHQAALIQSVKSYHSEWFKIWMGRLFSVPDDAFIRDTVMGWYEIDRTKLGPAAPIVAGIAKQLTDYHFDLFRLKLGKSGLYQNKWYKWSCGCGRPTVRAAGKLFATCDNCGEYFKLQRKGVPDDIWNRTPKDRREEDA